MISGSALLIIAEQLEDVLVKQRSAGSYIDPLLRFMSERWSEAKKRVIQVILSNAWEGRREAVIKRLFDAEDALPKGLLARSTDSIQVHSSTFGEAVIYGKRGIGTARSAKGNPIKLYFDTMTANDIKDMKALWGDDAIYMSAFETGAHDPNLTALVAKDAAGNIHGAILYESPATSVISKYSDNGVFVRYLETAPFNRGAQGNSGIGTNLLARASMDVKPNGKLMLLSDERAVGFYEKIGMVSGPELGDMYEFTFEEAKAFADEVGVSRSSKGRKIPLDSIDLTNDPGVRDDIADQAGRVVDDFGKAAKVEIASIRAQAQRDTLPRIVQGTQNRTSVTLSREGFQEVIDALKWQEDFVDDLALTTRERVKRLLNSRYGNLDALETHVNRVFRTERDELIQTFKQAVNVHANDVVAGKISPATFEARMQKTINQYYPKLYRAGSGKPTLSVADQAYIKQQAQSQAQYLANFRQYIGTQNILGNELTARVNYRAQLYAERGSALFEKGFISANPDDMLYDWILQPAEHCRTCPIFADNSPYTKDTLPGMPGEGFHLTECGTMCKCIVDRSQLYHAEGGVIQEPEVPIDEE